MNVFEQLEAEVQQLVDEATPDLLPMLLKIFLKDDRPGLVTCERHTQKLFPYVRAQINLTRAKRNYYRDDNWWGPCTHRSLPRDTPSPYHAGTEHFSTQLGPEESYRQATITRDNIRQIYRSTPCTCWVPHR